MRPHARGRRRGFWHAVSRAVVISSAAGVAAAVAACGLGDWPNPPDRVISVFAAASLRDVMAAVEPAYADGFGIRLQTSTDSSSALRVQIEQGAEVDVFLSADTVNPDALLAGGLVDGSVMAFAQNGLAIVVPKANPGGVVSALDLGRPGLKVVAAGDGVPISTYADALILNLANDSPDPAAFLAAYAANVVTREDNVRAVLAKIALGEGDAAIVYATDAKAASAVLIIPIPAGFNVLATYAGVVPTTARHVAMGHTFLDWLAGPAGQALLARFGFSNAVPGPS